MFATESMANPNHSRVDAGFTCSNWSNLQIDREKDLMPRNHSITIAAGLVAALIAQLIHSPNAAAGKFIDQTGCSQCCPECNHTCRLDVEEVEVDKTCFEVETEIICIPRVVFPWQRKSVRRARSSCDSCEGLGCKHCGHKGAKTREVKILSSRKYKCPKCEFAWIAEKKPCNPCGGGGFGSGCDQGEFGGDAYLTPPRPAEVLGPPPAEVQRYGDAESNGLEMIEVHQP